MILGVGGTCVSLSIKSYNEATLELYTLVLGGDTFLVLVLHGALTRETDTQRLTHVCNK